MAIRRKKVSNDRTTADKIYRYVVDHDMGFSPNPFHGFCTLANCKPVIRRCACIGDLVLGFGAAKSDIQGKMIFWMEVEEIQTYDEYWIDPRFQIKKAVVNGSHIMFNGDNIYHSNNDGVYIQEHSFHSLPNGEVNLENRATDTGSTSRILISRNYGYYGEDAVEVPPDLESIVPFGRGHRTALDLEVKDRTRSWLFDVLPRGVRARPSGWKDIGR